MLNSTNALMEPWGYNLAAAVLTVIQIVGFLLNLLVILLMFKDDQIWNPINIIIFNLVCCDFAVSIVGNPFALISALSHRWRFGDLGCKLYGFIMSWLGITAITTISVMSFERYFLVQFPFSSKKLTNRGAIYSIFLIWIYTAAVTSPPLLGWGAYVNEAANISCSVNWEEQSSNARSYITFLFIFGLLMPLAVIIFCYANILITLRRSASRLNRTSPAEKKVAGMVFIMFTCFMIGWSPYAVFALIKQYGDKDYISPALGVVPSIFAKASICYNPIIYVGLNTQFRQAFDRLRGAKPNITKIITVTTTGNLLDSDAREAVKNRLQTVNDHKELQRTQEMTAEAMETIEMSVITDTKCEEKVVIIQIE